MMKLLCGTSFLVALAVGLTTSTTTVEAWAPSLSLKKTSSLRPHTTTTTTTTTLENCQRTQSSRLFLSSRSPTSGDSNVIQQLSPQCLSALMVAHRFGRQLEQTELSNELLLVGVVSRPEGAESFLSNNPEMKEFLGDVDQVKTAVATRLGASSSSMANGADDKMNQPLPFGSDAKQLLNKAYAIADYLGSRGGPNNAQQVRSEHVLLALLGYNFGRSRTILLSQTPCSTTLTQLPLPTMSLYDACETLISDLARQQQQRPAATMGATVAVGGDTGDSGVVLSGTLAQVGVDLTQLAMEGQLDPVFGRDDELRACLQTLGRRRKNNPCLVGEAGVGKTAIVEGLAQILAQPLLVAAQQGPGGISIQLPQFPQLTDPFGSKKKDEKEQDQEEEFRVVLPELPTCPKDLAGARLVSIDLASLVAGTANRGDFEKRVQTLIREASANNVILFFDEVHNLVGAGDPNGGAANAANLLKPALARGEIRVVGATTTPEYRRYIEKDTALERRFQPLKVQEPTVEEATKILASIVHKYEDFHGVEYTDKALYAAAKLADRYIADRFLPDKAIDLMDEAGSKLKQLQDFYDNDKKAAKEDIPIVTEDDMALCVSKFTGIPVGQLDTGEKERLRQLEPALKERIKGQDVAVKAVAKAIRRARSGMRDGKRPVATFLFAGPTGVGKTELCKALASTYFGQEKDMIRIDGSEYMDRFSSSRLVGAPPGYVGYDEGGQLTEAVRRSPHSVILFDEMEKAHEDVMNILLQVMDDGILTDGKGRRVNFKNTILVLTTNVGSQEILKLARSGGSSQDVASAVQVELEKSSRPEFLNRLDDIVVFNPLDYDKLKEITSNLVRETVDRVYSDSQITLDVSDTVQEAITRETLNVASEFGARPLRRAIQRYVEDSMAEAVISEFVQDGDSVKLLLKKAAPETTGEPAVVNVEVAGRGTVSITVDPEGGLAANEEAKLDAMAYGDLPDLDDDDDDDDDDDNGLQRETSAFQ